MTHPRHRVGVLASNSAILSSGSRDGYIYQHDVRIAAHHAATLAGHTHEVCGLKWNAGGTLLASGGNDNMSFIWDARNTRQTDLSSGITSPLHALPHQSGVKALSWCPFQAGLLATGGGSSDRCIRFWNSSTGACLNTIDTSSQVTQLLWSINSKELVSAHGFSQNHLTVWNYPSMTKAADLLGHSSRVLYLAMSPDGESFVSGAGDETLRIWKVFERESKPSTQTPVAKSSSLSKNLIR